MSQKAAGHRGPQMRAQIINPHHGHNPRGSKGGGKPSSQHIPGRRKSWLSLRETTDNRGNDTGKRSGQPWFRSPYMQEQKRIRQGA